MSDFSSGHGLEVPEFEPHSIGFSAVSTEPASGPLSPSLSAPPCSHARALSLSLSLSLSKINFKIKFIKMHQGRLGGSVSLASDFDSGHSLMVCEFKPHIRLCAVSLEPGACFKFCVFLSLSARPLLMLSLSKIK